MNLSWTLSEAIRANKLERVRELLKEGASVNSVSAGVPVLSLAASQGCTEIVKILLKSGADVNKASTKSGATPLYIATQEGNTGIVKILVSSGADVNKGTTDGTTPLYVAAQKGYTGIVKILLKYGAEVNRAALTTGATPLYIAAHQGYTEIVKTLLSYGADPFRKYHNLQTPRDGAKMNNHKEIVNLLTEHELSWNKSNFATRVMNISTQDMKVLPPLFLWLDSTPLSTFGECIHDLTQVEVEGKKVYSRLALTGLTVFKTVQRMKTDDTQTPNLSLDERAAIYIYTMELPKLFNGSNGSIYFLLNEFLRNQDRNSLQPFLKYLKLLLSALCKLPPLNAKVCRGVKADMAQEMKSKEKKDIVWNSFSSTTLDSKTLDNSMFLGSSGQRAVFFINCKSGRSIKHLSANQSEHEVLMLPCTCLRVEHVLVQGDLTIVHLTELDPHEDFTLLFAKTNSVQGCANQQVQIPNETMLAFRYKCELAFDASINIIKKRIDEIRGQLPQEEEFLIQALSKETDKVEQSYVSQSHALPEYLVKLEAFVQQQTQQLKEDNKRLSEQKCRMLMKELKSPIKTLLFRLESEEQLNYCCQVAVTSFEQKAIGPAKSTFKKQLLQFCEAQKKTYQTLMKLEEEKRALRNKISELEASLKAKTQQKFPFLPLILNTEKQRWKTKHNQEKTVMQDRHLKLEQQNQQLAQKIRTIESEKQQMDAQYKQEIELQHKQMEVQYKRMEAEHKEQMRTIKDKTVKKYVLIHSILHIFYLFSVLLTHRDNTFGHMFVHMCYIMFGIHSICKLDDRLVHFGIVTDICCRTWFAKSVESLRLMWLLLLVIYDMEPSFFSSLDVLLLTGNSIILGCVILVVISVDSLLSFSE